MISLGCAIFVSVGAAIRAAPIAVKEFVIEKKLVYPGLASLAPLVFVDHVPLHADDVGSALRAAVIACGSVAIGVSYGIGRREGFRMWAGDAFPIPEQAFGLVALFTLLLAGAGEIGILGIGATVLDAALSGGCVSIALAALSTTALLLPSARNDLRGPAGVADTLLTPDLIGQTAQTATRI